MTQVALGNIKSLRNLTLWAEIAQVPQGGSKSCWCWGCLRRLLAELCSVLWMDVSSCEMWMKLESVCVCGVSFVRTEWWHFVLLGMWLRSKQAAHQWQLPQNDKKHWKLHEQWETFAKTTTPRSRVWGTIGNMQLSIVAWGVTVHCPILRTQHFSTEIASCHEPSRARDRCKLLYFYSLHSWGWQSVNTMTRSKWRVEMYYDAKKDCPQQSQESPIHVSVRFNLMLWQVIMCITNNETFSDHITLHNSNRSTVTMFDTVHKLWQINACIVIISWRNAWTQITCNK